MISTSPLDPTIVALVSFFQLMNLLTQACLNICNYSSQSICTSHYLKDWPPNFRSETHISLCGCCSPASGDWRRSDCFGRMRYRRPLRDGTLHQRCPASRIIRTSRVRRGLRPRQLRAWPSAQRLVALQSDANTARRPSARGGDSHGEPVEVSSHEEHTSVFC